HKK
ncbi:ABC transporter ATP-binding protein uup, partial [Haemophilus influenzae]